MQQLNQFSLPVRCFRCEEVFDLSQDVYLDEEMMQDFIMAIKSFGMRGGMLCQDCRC